MPIIGLILNKILWIRLYASGNRIAKLLMTVQSWTHVGFQVIVLVDIRFWIELSRVRIEIRGLYEFSSRRIFFWCSWNDRAIQKVNKSQKNLRDISRNSSTTKWYRERSYAYTSIFSYNEGTDWKSAAWLDIHIWLILKNLKKVYDN